MTPLALSNLLADRVVYTSGGLGLVLIILLVFLLWPVPATGPAPDRSGLLWVVVLLVLVLLVVGFI
jgi:hypothetical protein